MEIIVLGSSGAFPGPGRACSGYLVQGRGTTLLMDLGSGVLANLQRHVGLSEIDAVLISHLHADHFLDLYLLQVYLQFGSDRTQPLPVYGPPGADERVNRLQPGTGTERFYEVFDFRPWQAGETLRVGNFGLRTTVTEHAELTYAIRIEEAPEELGPSLVVGRHAAEAVAGASLTYTADTGPSSQVDELAQGTDILLAECSWMERPQDEAVGHLTAREAGEMAERVRASRLVLTHFWPTMDRDAARTAAQAVFSRAVHAATEGSIFVL